MFLLIPLFLVGAAGLAWWGMTHASSATTAQIAAAQVMLSALVHSPAPGGDAVPAVEAFQSEAGQPVTGWYDARTYAAARGAIPAAEWPLPWPAMMGGKARKLLPMQAAPAVRRMGLGK